MSRSGLLVRRTERFDISLPAQVRIAKQHVEMVLFAKGVAGDDRWIDVDVVDFSEGGVGFAVESFFPRSVDLELRILQGRDSASEVLLQCEMKVKRVQMTDRRPAYLVGCSFQRVDEQGQQSIQTLINRLLGDGSGENSGGVDHA